MYAEKRLDASKELKICSEHFSPYLITANHHLHNVAIPTLKGGDQLFLSVEEGV